MKMFTLNLTEAQLKHLEFGIQQGVASLQQTADAINQQLIAQQQPEFPPEMPPLNSGQVTQTEQIN